MQFERVVIDAGAESFSLRFHDRLTVIAGIGQLEREGLVNELVGALGSGRSGVHLEMISDAGTRFAIRRPDDAEDVVINTSLDADVSDQFRAEDGTIDLLAKAGLDRASAKRAMRLGSDEIHTASETERYVHALAGIDQGRLWELVEKVERRESELADEAGGSGSTIEDVEAVARVEELHRTADAAQEEHERLRSWTLWVAVGLALVALPLGMAFGTGLLVVCMAVAALLAVVSLRQYQEVELAREAEAEALSAVGASDYLSFHLQRVNRLLSNDTGRQRLMGAAELHRAALAEWQLLAGEIPVRWARDHRDEIRSAARARGGGQRIGRVADATLEVTSDVVRDVSASVMARLADLRTLGPGGERFPAILDDPFALLPESARPKLMEMLAEASTTQQIILLTQDPAVAAWARVESMTGTVDIIEPAGSDVAEGPGADAANPTHRRHAAA